MERDFSPLFDSLKHKKYADAYTFIAVLVTLRQCIKIIYIFFNCGACKYRWIHFQCRLRYYVWIQEAHNRFFQVLCVRRGLFKHPCCKILALAV